MKIRLEQFYRDLQKACASFLIVALLTLSIPVHIFAEDASTTPPVESAAVESVVSEEPTSTPVIDLVEPVSFEDATTTVVLIDASSTEATTTEVATEATTTEVTTDAPSVEATTTEGVIIEESLTTSTSSAATSSLQVVTEESDNESNTATTTPPEPESITVTNLISHPVAGEYWNISFVTQGVENLTIVPADQQTLDDMQFTTLKCGSETHTPEILPNGVIYVSEWSCDGSAVASFLVKHTGHHHMLFHFGSASAEAFNGTITWDGGGGDNNWSTCTNWLLDVCPTSGDAVLFNGTSVKDATVDAGFAGTISGLQIDAGYSGTITMARSLVTSTFSQAAGTFDPQSFAFTVKGNFTISGGTYLPGTGTITFGVDNEYTIDVNTSQTFYSAVFNAGSHHGFIAANDTLVINGTTTMAAGFLDGTSGSGTIQPIGDVVVNGVDDGSAIILFDQPGTSTITYNSGRIPVLKINNAATTVVVSGSSLNVKTFNLVDGTFVAPANLTVVGTFSISGGTFTPGTGTVTFMNNIDVATTQTFNSVTFNAGFGTHLAIASGDTLEVNGTTTIAAGYLDGPGIVHPVGSTVVNGGDGGSAVILLDQAGTTDITSISGRMPELKLNNAGTTFNVVGSALQVQTFNQQAGTFNAPASLYVAGSFTLAGGTYNASADLTIAGSTTIGAGGTFNANTGTVSLGSGTTDVNVTQTFYNLTFAAGFGNHGAVASGDTLEITGTTTLATGYLDGPGIVHPQGQVVLNGCHGGSGIILFDIPGTSNITSTSGRVPELRINNAGTTVTIDGSSLSVEKFTLQAGTFVAPASLEVVGQFTISGGTFTPGTGTVTFLNDVDVNGSQEFNNVVFNVSFGSHQNIASNDVVIVNGTTTLNSGVIDGSVGTGIIEARGNVVVSSSMQGGTAPLRFAGSAVQTFDMTGATGLFDAPITVNKSGGSVKLLSALLMDASSQHLLITSGALDLNGKDLTVNGSSATLIVQNGGDLQLRGEETITANTSNPQLQSSSTVTYYGTGGPYTIKNYTYSNLAIVGSGSFTAPSSLTLGGTFTQSAGTFTAPSSVLNVAGNFDHSAGTFSHNSGSVVLNGTNQAITGTTTFNSLTKIVSSADTLTLGANQTQTFLGALTLEGASSNLLSVRSDSNGVQAKIDPQAAVSVSYLNVKDNNNINATAIDATDTGSVNAGNNTNWIFNSTITQSDFRWYENSNTLQPSIALAAQNGGAVLTSTSSPVRLVMNLLVESFALPITSMQFKLQYATSTVNAMWTDVGKAPSETPDAGWFDQSWLNRRKITFDNSSSGTDLTDFPVLVTLNATSTGNIDYTKTKASGADIRFTDADGTTPLAYEIETWDPTATSTIWVKVPSLAAGSTTDSIFMYYNNPAASDGQSATSVWSNDYAIVQHLGDGSTLSLTDSTSNGRNGTAVATNGFPLPSAGVGKIGGGAVFTGGGDSGNASKVAYNGTALTAFSASIWLKPTTNASLRGVMEWQANDPFNGSWNAPFFLIQNDNGTLRYYADGSYRDSSQTVSTNTFYLLTVTLSGSNTWKFYLNGSLLSTYTGGVSQQGNALSFNIAEGYSGGTTGVLDELEVSSGVARSPDWILAQYKSQSDIFNTYSAEETGTPIWKFYDNPGVAGGTTKSANLLSTSNVFGTYEESNPSAFNPYAIAAGQYAEWDWVLDPINLPANVPYYFRMTQADRTPLDAYSIYPSITLLGENAPTTPSSLGPSSVVNGGWISTNQPTLTFTLTDPDVLDTLRYDIQIASSSDFSDIVVDYTSALGAQGPATFTVGQAAGSGTYTLGSSGQTLADSTSGYYWRVRAIDNVGAVSSYSTANSGGVAFKIDTTPPASSSTPSTSGGGGGGSSNTHNPPGTGTSTPPGLIDNPGLGHTDSGTGPYVVVTATTSANRAAVKAVLYGISGNATYQLDCEKDGVVDQTKNTPKEVVVFNECIYLAPGEYRARVVVTSPNKKVVVSDEARIVIAENTFPTVVLIDTPPVLPSPSSQQIPASGSERYPEIAYLDPISYVISVGVTEVTHLIESALDAVTYSTSSPSQTRKVIVVDVPVIANTVVEAVPGPRHLVPLLVPIIPALSVSLGQFVNVLSELPYVDDVVAYTWQLIMSLLGFFGIKRKRNHLGTVFNSTTGEPIGLAYVTLHDADTGERVSVSISDAGGKYGFFVRPGSYTIRVAKRGYLFPSKNDRAHLSYAALYKNVYSGDVIKVHTDAFVATRNIALDPISAEGVSRARVHPALRRMLYGSVTLLFICGLISSLYGVVRQPDAVNALLVLAYCAGLIFQVGHVREWGRIYEGKSGRVLSGLLVELTTEGRVTDRAITDVYGRFLLHTAPGRYILNMYQFGRPQPVAVRSVFVGKSGVINKDLII